jgi:hypothetical protein
MSSDGGSAVLRRAASFSTPGCSKTPLSPSSPFSRASSSKSASSFGCSVLPSCIHWRHQQEGSESYEMLHFHDDSVHVRDHFGDIDVFAIDGDDDFNSASSPVRHESVGDFSSDFLADSHSSPGQLSRRTSAPPEISAHAPETKLTRLITSFQRCIAQKHPGPDPAIHLILRGIELKQHACQLLANCFSGHDVCALDIAPRVRFDSDSKSYVHCRMGGSILRLGICVCSFRDSGDCDPNTGNDGMRTLLRMLQQGPKRGHSLIELIIPRCNIGQAFVSSPFFIFFPLCFSC